MAFVGVVRIDEIPVGHGVLVERDGLPLAVFNAGGGRFHATGPTCPHEDGPLSEGWIEAGLEKLERVLPFAERARLTPIQLACQWNLAHEPVECVVPTLIQEAGADAKPIEQKREELAHVKSDVELDVMRKIKAAFDPRGILNPGKVL